MKQPKTKFGTAIRNERLKRFMTQADVASVTKLSRPTVNRMETEEFKPHPAQVASIAWCFEGDLLKWLKLALPDDFPVWQRAFRSDEKEK